MNTKQIFELHKNYGHEYTKIVGKFHSAESAEDAMNKLMKSDESLSLNIKPTYTIISLPLFDVSITMSDNKEHVYYYDVTASDVIELLKGMSLSSDIDMLEHFAIQPA